MLELGDYVIYGSTGIFRIDEIGTIDVGSAYKDKLYYTLVPMDTKHSKVFTPVENERNMIRSLMTKAEAEAFIEDMENVIALQSSEENGKDLDLKECIRSGGCHELAQVIKTLYARKNSRDKNGKKISLNDDRHLKAAEEILYSELAFVMMREKEDVRMDVLDRLIEKK